jgi:hypothetical protein
MPELHYFSLFIHLTSSMPHIIYKPYQDPQPPHRLPNNPPSKLPPAPPALPPLLASVSNHSLKFLICSGLVSFVSSCASCLLNANNVGIDVICISSAPFPIPTSPFLPPLPYRFKHTIYRIPISPIKTLSNSTSTNPTPPSFSPTFSSSIRLRTSGFTA